MNNILCAVSCHKRCVQSLLMCRNDPVPAGLYDVLEDDKSTVIQNVDLPNETYIVDLYANTLVLVNFNRIRSYMTETLQCAHKKYTFYRLFMLLKLFIIICTMDIYFILFFNNL